MQPQLPGERVEMEAVGGVLVLESAPCKACKLPPKQLPCFPPTVLSLDLLFFRQLFDQLQAQGLVHDGEIHVAKLHALAVRLLDLLGENGLCYFGARFFGCDQGKVFMTWKDMRRALASDTVEGFPDVKLSFAERVYVTLDRPSSSKMAQLYTMLMTFAIGLNLALVVVQTLDNCNEVLPQHNGRCGRGAGLETCFIMMFSLDFALKLISVAQVRIHVCDRDRLLQLAAHTDTDLNKHLNPVLRTRWARIGEWVSHPMNIFDLCSVLPFWLDLLFGTLMPPGSATFLRALRLLRMFRILKTGRYSLTLQALGTVLQRSLRSVSVLLMYIIMTSLIGGVILQQVELGETFNDVPNATWWVFVRLIGSQHSSPYAEGRPISIIGCALVAVIMMCKGILWILPFGQIGTVFREEWAAILKGEELAKELEAECSQADSFNCTLSRTFSAHVAVWPISGKEPESSGLLRTLTGIPSSSSLSLRHMALEERDETGDAQLPKPWAMNSVPVPIFKADDFSSTIDVPLAKGMVQAQTWVGRVPRLEVEIAWKADDRMKRGESAGMPCGELSILSLRASDLGGTETDRWLCRFSVPVALRGGSRDGAIDMDAPKVWYKECVSDEAGPDPRWSTDPEFSFALDWSVDTANAAATGGAAQPSSGRTAASPRCSDDDAGACESRILQLLEAHGRQLAQQSERLAALESLAAALKTP